MIDLLYENGPCFVVNKPAGLLTQAPEPIDCLERRMKNFLRERECRTGNVYLGVPHRLDRPVSGTIIFCRHARAARRISEQFQARTVRKIYHAMVEGILDEDSGTWTDFMRKIPDHAQAEIVSPDHSDAREGVLHFRVLRRFRATGTESDLTEEPMEKSRTLLEIELETGRMHQIRLQCGVRGHAILGDAQYGSTIPFGEAHQDERLRAIALHAASITFHLPTPPFERITIEAPEPTPWSTDIS
ncbi:MAG: RNA pseudouridine synthase [Planctomycetia bacterium]|nr:RNA pseudouridine synthase [Planctomycetia bacterium]